MVDVGRTDWDMIVERHGKRVFRTAMRILGSVQDAEDVSQDVFVEAFRRQKEEPVHSWAGFLVRLATLRSIDRIRQQRPIAELRESDRMSTIEPFEEAAATELADWLRRSLTQLSEQQAAVFVMTHFEGLSRDEIANSLGISRQAISTALYKARQRLLTQLAVFRGGESK